MKITDALDQLLRVLTSEGGAERDGAPASRPASWGQPGDAAAVGSETAAVGARPPRAGSPEPDRKDGALSVPDPMGVSGPAKSGERSSSSRQERSPGGRALPEWVQRSRVSAGIGGDDTSRGAYDPPESHSPGGEPPPVTGTDATSLGAITLPPERPSQEPMPADTALSHAEPAHPEPAHPEPAEPAPIGFGSVEPVLHEPVLHESVLDESVPGDPVPPGLEDDPPVEPQALAGAVAWAGTERESLPDVHSELSSGVSSRAEEDAVSSSRPPADEPLAPAPVAPSGAEVHEDVHETESFDPVAVGSPGEGWDETSTDLVPAPSSPDLARLESTAGVVESLNLGFHLGSAVERIAAAAGQGSEGIPALRQAAWLIDRYVALLERRPIGADLHLSAARLARTGDTITDLKALAAALDAAYGPGGRFEEQSRSASSDDAHPSPGRVDPD